MGKARKARRRRGRSRSVRLSRAAAELVRWARVARVATAGLSGMPHLVPVCHVLQGGKIYLGSGKRGRKVTNIRANPQLAITVDQYSEDWSALRGVMVQGRGAVIEPGRRFRRIRRLLYRKYPQYPAKAALGDSDSLIIELTPTHVFTWGLD
jgi:nitroimidazol reductase NimA-like FMN-containing flavoprotein (pyridoxamine 5'-phosphate oxidase superfamily)